MNITLDQVGKRYTSGWVLRNITTTIKAGDRIGIKGPNGSGKSTLLQLIMGYLTNSEGTITYQLDDKAISRDDIYQYCAIATAYMEMDEELTPLELFEHYQHFKPFLIKEASVFLDMVDLGKEKSKQVRYFSSGMKQRLMLGLAMAMDVPLLLLDEPTSFLDKERKIWFKEMLSRFSANKTLIIASNDDADLAFCNRFINLE